MVGAVAPDALQSPVNSYVTDWSELNVSFTLGVFVAYTETTLSNMTKATVLISC